MHVIFIKAWLELNRVLTKNVFTFVGKRMYNNSRPKTRSDKGHSSETLLFDSEKISVEFYFVT